jgi:Arc/MetJ family transcription regulator
VTVKPITVKRKHDGEYPYDFSPFAVHISSFRYTTCMVQRTTVEFDVERLAEVRQLLGTTGIKDTIDAAFEQIVRQARRMALLDQMRDPEKFDFTEEVFRQARPLTP